MGALSVLKDHIVRVLVFAERKCGAEITEQRLSILSFLDQTQ